MHCPQIAQYPLVQFLMSSLNTLRVITGYRFLDGQMLNLVPSGETGRGLITKTRYWMD